MNTHDNRPTFERALEQAETPEARLLEVLSPTRHRRSPLLGLTRCESEVR